MPPKPSVPPPTRRRLPGLSLPTAKKPGTPRKDPRTRSTSGGGSLGRSGTTEPRSTPSSIPLTSFVIPMPSLSPDSIGDASRDVSFNNGLNLCLRVRWRAQLAEVSLSLF